MRVLLSDYAAPDISAEIPFLFKQAGCAVDIYCGKHSWLRKNSYFDTWYEADTRAPSTYVKGLIERAEQTDYDWIVLTEDEAICAANELIQDDAIALRILPITAPEDRVLLGSKKALALSCQAHDILSPTFSIITNETELDTPSFPLVLKVDRSSGGQGVFLCNNAEEARTVWSKLSLEEKTNLIAQQYIPGMDIAVEAIFQKGTVLSYTRSRVLENMNGEFSVSSVRKYEPDPEMELLLRHIGDTLSLDGFYNMTFREEAASKRLYLIEADARPNIWFAAARTVGLDFSEAITAYLTRSSRENPLTTGAGILLNFYRDVNRALEQCDMLTLCKWVFNINGRWNYIPWYDRRLLLATFRLLIRTRKEALVRGHPWLRTLKRNLTVRSVGATIGTV